MHVQITHTCVVKPLEQEQKMFFLIFLAIFFFGTEGMNGTLPEWKDLECVGDLVCSLLIEVHIHYFYSFERLATNTFSLM